VLNIGNHDVEFSEIFWIKNIAISLWLITLWYYWQWSANVSDSGLCPRCLICFALLHLQKQVEQLFFSTHDEVWYGGLLCGIASGFFFVPTQKGGQLMMDGAFCTLRTPSRFVFLLMSWVRYC